MVGMRTSSMEAMVSSAVLLLDAIHAWREALHLAAMCERMEYTKGEEERYKSLSSPSDGASDYRSRLVWSPWYVCSGESRRHTSAGSAVECVKSVRLVALDSGRSLVLRTRSVAEVAMMSWGCATVRYRTRPESCRGRGETQRNG